MRCQKLRSLLPEYCKAELSGSTLAAIERHFHTCASCRKELAAHRLTAVAITDLSRASAASAAGAIMEHTTSSMDGSPRPMYRVSEDFNSRLLNRIAEERYAEVNASASLPKNFLPKKAPLFGRSRLAPAFASAAIVALVAVGFVRQAGDDSQAPAQSAEQEALEDYVNNTPATAAAPLGERLGLNSEYMTAQPLDNPTFAGKRADQSSVTGQSFAAKTAAATRMVSSPRWEFARELERARRIMRISNSMGMGHTYFEIVQRRSSSGSGIVIVRIDPYLSSPRLNQPQIIIQANPLRPGAASSATGRVVGGSF